MRNETLTSGPQQAASIEKILFREQRDRDDASEYIGGLLVRQRQVNHEVFAFGQGFLKPGAVVIDACAGPEGSILAAARNGYTWVGNDISSKFASNLRSEGADRVVLSDFSQTPYREGIADCVAFVFALNNILKPKHAVEEASRITTDEGKVLIADPGPTRWVTGILLYTLLGDQSKKALTDKKYKEIEEFFSAREYTAEEYTNSFIENRLGIDRQELTRQASSLLPDNETSAKKWHRVNFYFHELLVEKFYSHLQELFEGQGFYLERAGIMGASQESKEKEWKVSSPFEVDANDWVNSLSEARKAASQLPEYIRSSQHRLIFPILCFSKKESN